MGYENLKFNKGTKFLITGVAGFIGSNIATTILKMGYEVVGLDNYSTGKRENVKELENNILFKFIEGDIRNFETASNACENIDYVLHQAALGSVPRSIKEPRIYEDNNINGTANMMEAARLNSVKRFVYASSSSVYGDSPILPKKEGAEGNPLSPYALTKSVTEMYGKLYTKLYNLECIGLRYFNVFGRKQDPNSQYAAVIPKFIKSLKAGLSIEIYGDGEQSRDFTYIENVIEANLKACIAPSKACGRAYNIAYGERYTVNEMYNLLCQKLDIIRKPIYISERVGDVKHSLANINDARELLGYNPSWSFSEGFIKAVDWYDKNI